MRERKLCRACVVLHLVPLSFHTRTVPPLMGFSGTSLGSIRAGAILVSACVVLVGNSTDAQYVVPQGTVSGLMCDRNFVWLIAGSCMKKSFHTSPGDWRNIGF